MDKQSTKVIQVYQIGDEINLWCEYENQFVIGEITKIAIGDVDKVCIRKKYGPLTKATWIHIHRIQKTNKQILFDKHHVNIIFLQPFRPLSPEYVSQINSTFYCTSWTGSYTEIYKYNMQTDQPLNLGYAKISKILDLAAMDYIKNINTLFIATNKCISTSSKEQIIVLYKLNLNDKKDKLIKIKVPIIYSTSQPLSLIVNNGYHIVTSKEYIYINDNNKKWLYYPLPTRAFTIVSLRKSIIAFNKNTVFWKINIDHTQRNFTKIINLNKPIVKTPIWMQVYFNNYVQIYNDLIMVINQGNIAFMNLLSHKWHEAEMKIPILDNYYRIKVINGENNYLYFMLDKAYTYYMIKLNCLDIIPSALTVEYLDIKYKSLVMAFTNNFERNHRLFDIIPDCLKKAMIQYIPCFLY